MLDLGNIYLVSLCLLERIVDYSRNCFNTRPENDFDSASEKSVTSPFTMSTYKLNCLQKIAWAHDPVEVWPVQTWIEEYTMLKVSKMLNGKSEYVSIRTWRRPQLSLTVVFLLCSHSLMDAVSFINRKIRSGGHFWRLKYYLINVVFPNF